MENQKTITIKDMDNKLHFRIRLFDAEKGLDFIDNYLAQSKEGKVSVKPYLNDLLPLASMLDTNGHQIVKEGLTLQDCYGFFQNPLSVIELGIEILKFQQVFMQNSEMFQPLTTMLSGMWNTRLSGLQTQ